MKKLSFIICLLLAIQIKVFGQKLAANATDALITVHVINERNRAQSGETVTFESMTTKKLYTGITKENGKFEILVPKGDKYKVKYKAFTSDTDYTTLDVPNNKDELLEFEVIIQFELPKKYTLDNVYFETGKSFITSKSYKELDELVEYMKLKKTLVIEIAGHTDNVGVAEANMKLSQDRANAVRDYLLRKGIAPDRVIAKGYGDTQPIASNETDIGKQKNRRTEVRVLRE